MPNEVELNSKNASVAIVGKDMDFTLYEDDKVEPYLKAIEGDERPRRGGATTTAPGDSQPPGDKPDDKAPAPQGDVEEMSVD